MPRAGAAPGTLESTATEFQQAKEKGWSTERTTPLGCKHWIWFQEAGAPQSGRGAAQG